MKTAKFIKSLPDWRGNAALYELNTPIGQQRYNDDGDLINLAHQYVVVSEATGFGTGPETYIFGATETGEVVNFAELEGSRRGSYTHEDVLHALGYELKL